LAKIIATGKRGLFAIAAATVVFLVTLCPYAQAERLVQPGKNGDRIVKMEIVEQRLTKNGEPFVPLGFVVFGVDDESMQTMKEMGCNSIHFEFDSLYSERLGNLMAGITKEIFDIDREVSVTFQGREDTEVITSLSGTDTERYLLVLNASTLAKDVTVRISEMDQGCPGSLRTGKRTKLHNGHVETHFDEYGYDLYEIEMGK